MVLPTSVITSPVNILITFFKVMKISFIKVLLDNKYYNIFAPLKIFSLLLTFSLMSEFGSLRYQ